MESVVRAPPRFVDATHLPDWQTITHDVTCPLCGYNLRGLIEPRCPECGYQFEWPSVLDPSKHQHPYLFEHHRRHNVRSFFQTLFRSPLSPAKFWYTLEPSHKVRVWRLLFYWLVYAAVPILGIVVGIISNNANPRFYYLSTPWITRLRLGAQEMRWSGVVASVVLFALFPWFNFLALLVFQQSIRRARVRPVQVLRCAIYCGDLTLFFAFGLIVMLAVVDPRDGLQTVGHPLKSFFLGGSADDYGRPLLIILGTGVLAMVLLNSTRLWVAYRAYLRFERALALVVASQIVAFLAIIAVLAWTSEYVR